MSPVQPGSPAAGPDDRGLASAWSWCAGLALLLLPLLLFDRPYLQDFANHLSRVELTLAIDDPVIAANYEVLPLRPGNAAFDFFVRTLSAVMAPVQAGKLFVILSLVLIGTGALALRRSFGLPIDLPAIAALPFLYSASFSFGFLTYLMGMGLALHAMALWVWTGRGPPVLRVLCVPAAILLATVHFYSLGIFAIFAAAESWWRLGGATRWRSPGFWLRGLADGLVFVPSLAVLVFFGESAELSKTAAIKWSFGKPIDLLIAGMGFGPWWMSLLALGSWSAILVAALRDAAIRIDPRAALAGGAMLVAFVLLPQRLGDLWSVDWRILNCAVFVLLAGVTIDRTARARVNLAVAQILVLLAVMAAALTSLWMPAVAARRDVLALTEAIPPGSRLFWVVTNGATNHRLQSRDYGIYHVASNVAAPRRLLVSTTFTLPGQHPLRFRDPVLRSVGNLSMLGARDLEENLPGRRSPRLDDIVTRFDYVLLYGPPAIDDVIYLPLGRMKPVATRGGLRLYAIDRPQR